MIFRKNKQAPEPGGTNAAMRGRDSQPGKRSSNALARRFLVDDEPDTIDLAGPAGFPGSENPDEPETRVASAAPQDVPVPGLVGIIGQNPDTGKFYVHAGTAETPVFLGDEPVTAPTELRKGDRVRVGGAEFEFLA